MLTILLIYVLFVYFLNKHNLPSTPSRLSKYNIELTVRLTLTKNKFLERLFCEFLRSTVLFWNPNYGDILIILDEEDEQEKIESKFNALRLPFKFRFFYEENLVRHTEIENILQKRPSPGGYGYERMLYSSFLLDLYTDENTILAWGDTDMSFILPVTNDSIFKNGKLIVKGINDLNSWYAIPWVKSTFFALGLPMVSDFMSYFPSYVHPRTIRNCRHLIMRRLNATTFEEAFIKIVEYDSYISPVNMILSYAFYFEKELYDWHIDINPETLSSYNAKVIPLGYELLKDDTTPELHTSVHSGRHNTDKIQPLEQAICYSQIALGMTNIPHCDRFRNETHLKLFEFETKCQSHVMTWCEPGPKREHCKELIDDRYKRWVDYYNKTGTKLDTSYLNVIQNYAKKTFGITCHENSPLKKHNYKKRNKKKKQKNEKNNKNITENQNK